MMKLGETVKCHFFDCMIYANYNISLCARVMGVTNKTIYNYCIKYKMDSEYIEKHKFSDAISIENKREKRNRSTRKKPNNIEFQDLVYGKINWDEVKYFATNEERLIHADSMLNRETL